MPEVETSPERITRLVKQAKLSFADVASALNVSEQKARRIMAGSTATLKLVDALALCKKLLERGVDVTPWELGGMRPPRSASEVPDVNISNDLEQIAIDVVSLAQRVGAIARRAGDEALAEDLERRAQGQLPPRRSGTTRPRAKRRR